MIADSSFIVALYAPKDTLHEKALATFESGEFDIVLPDRILEESLTVLAYRNGWEFALQVLDKISANSRYAVRRLGNTEVEEAFALVRKHGTKMSFNDYLVLSLSLKEGTVPLCYDDQILRLAKK